MLAESGFLNLALQYHTQDLELSEKHGKPLDIAVAHRKVGEVFAELGEFPAAISHQEQFMKITTDLGDLLEQQRANATLGRTYYTQLMSETEERVRVPLRKKAGLYYITALKLVNTLRSKRLSSEKEVMEVGLQANSHAFKYLHCNLGLLG